jgi:deoxycytidine triphosphate deaminase
MFKSGAFVAKQLSGVRDEQVQPNGVDLTVEAIFDQQGPGRIARGGRTIGDRRAIPLSDDETTATEAAAGVYALQPASYILQYAEEISIPTDHVGFVYPRSSLLRNSCMLETAVWDAGYTGRGEGRLTVGHEIVIEPGARVAQLVLASADHDGEYDGAYQGERL